MKISAAIIAFNESENIAAACESVAWADEIIVVDSESTDDTRKIAENCGARVLIKKWEGFARQKQFAADSTGNDWVLSLDADERVSENLRDEILTLKKSPTSQLADGYKIPRRNRYMNRWMKHGGWYPDWQLRLYLKTKGLWKDVLVHESVTMSDDARTAKLSGDLLHHSIPNAAYHHRLLGERYAPLAARQMFDNKRKTSDFKIMTVGATTFLSQYLLKGGFRDGLPGFCAAKFSAHHAFLKHLLLRELQENNDE